MKRQKQNKQTFTPVKHFPRQPFGKHAAKDCIEIQVARNYDDPHVPLSGCTLTEPIGDADKDLLVRMGLARFDGGGRFEPDFPAMRARLRTVCRWNDADVTGATWTTILDTLREREQPANRHSEDYSSVTWHGKSYTFAPTQARAVRILWEAHQNGTPDVHQATIHERVDSSSESQRLRDLFKNHPAWGTMIVSGEGKGMFRLSS